MPGFFVQFVNLWLHGGGTTLTVVILIWVCGDFGLALHLA